LAVVAMCLIAFFSYLTVGMLAPFLPQHLTAIGIDERWSGVIFAVYSVAAILTTPLANIFVARFGRVVPIASGLVVQAVSAFVFGTFSDNLGILLLSRFTQGCGASASNMAILALVTDLYADSMGQKMALWELFIGAGFSIGPLFGALLYSSGGFPLPFITCSAMLAALAALTPCLASVQGSSGSKTSIENGAGQLEDQAGGAMDRIWRICTADLVIPAGLMLLGTIVWGIIDSGFYTVHAAGDLHLSQKAIGINLAAASGAYSLLGQLVGARADRVGHQELRIMTCA